MLSVAGNERRDRANVPFRTAEAEAAGQVALERLPELGPLLIRQVEDSVVVLLELVVLLDDGGEPRLAVGVVAMVGPLSKTAAPALYCCQIMIQPETACSRGSGRGNGTISVAYLLPAVATHECEMSLRTVRY